MTPLVLSFLVVLVIQYWLCMRESFEILYSSFQSSNHAHQPPPLKARIENTGDDNYVVNFDSRNMSVQTIFLHRPEDEPMLHYVIKGAGPIKHDTLPSGTKAEVWVVESTGRCWSSAPIELPASGKKTSIDISVAFCI